MNPARQRALAMLVFRLVLGGYMLWDGIPNILEGAAGSTHSDLTAFHLLVRGALKTFAALLFLFPRTLQIGAVLVGLIAGGGFLYHALHGDVMFDLVVYTSGVIVVALDDRASRAALTRG